MKKIVNAYLKVRRVKNVMLSPMQTLRSYLRDALLSLLFDNMIHWFQEKYPSAKPPSFTRQVNIPIPKILRNKTFHHDVVELVTCVINDLAEIPLGILGYRIGHISTCVVGDVLQVDLTAEIQKA